MRSNYDILFDLMTQYNSYIGEQTIGVDNYAAFKRPHILKRINKEIYMSPICNVSTLILLHKHCSFALVEVFLENALLTGELHPYDYAYIYEFSVWQVMLNNCKGDFKKRFNVWTKERKNVEYINNCRKEIFLPSLSHRDSIDKFCKLYKVNYNACK